MLNNDCITEQDITLYCTEDLDADQMQAAAEHFTTCQHCRDKMTVIKRALAATPQSRLEMSEAEKRQFSDRVMQAANRKQFGSRIQTWGTAAAAIAAGLVAVFIFSPDNLPPQPGQHPAVQYADLDLVENMEMLEELELLEMMELLEMLEDNS